MSTAIRRTPSATHLHGLYAELSRELERTMMLEKRELELRNERMKILENLKRLKEEKSRLLNLEALQRAQTYRSNSGAEPELGGQPFNQADFNYQCYVEDYK